MSTPIMTPRANSIAAILTENTQSFCVLEGDEVVSRQIRALINATAIQLADIESVIVRLPYPQSETKGA